ncbi:Arm DNA-binding domain-containing protein, partial [Salmonella enterica subsp. enterica serovar Anatum]|nr:Arm DNA-binding domain-containing protein [Salmonella enterica subsp. enterica serovar Anatum]
RLNMGLGPYQEVSLAEARDKARELRRQIRNGIDPLKEKHAQKPKRYAIGEAISHKIRCFSANEGYGQLWDIAYNLHYHTCHSMP